MEPRPFQPNAIRAATSTLAGCLTAALICLAVWPSVDARILDMAPSLQVAASLLAYLLGAVVIQWTGVAAFQMRYGPVSGMNAGPRWVRLGLLSGGAAALALAVGIATLSGFSTAPSTVALELVTVLACCWLGAYAGATWWAMPFRERAAAGFRA